MRNVRSSYSVTFPKWNRAWLGMHSPSATVIYRGGGVNICCGEEAGERLGMTVLRSHDSLCLQCLAEFWERSGQGCDLNRHDQSVSWLAIITVTKWGGKDLTLYVQHCRKQIKKMKKKRIKNTQRQTLLMTDKLRMRMHTCEVTPVLTQTGQRRIKLSRRNLSTFSLSCCPFNLSLSSLSISQSSPCSLIFTQACYTGSAGKSEREERRRAVDGNGSHMHSSFSRKLSAQAR